jgi:hypothetical protein
LKQNFVHWPARADNHNARNDIISHRIIVNLCLVQTTPIGPGISSPTRSHSMPLFIKAQFHLDRVTQKVLLRPLLFWDAKNKFDACIAAIKQIKQNLNEIK